MSKYYELKEVTSIRDEISKLGERKFPLLERQLEKAIEEWREARAEWEEAKTEKTMAEMDKAMAKCDEVRKEWKRIIVEWDIKLFDVLNVVCPEAYFHDWARYLVVPRNEEEDWIIPVFADENYEMKNKAFSIWEMPKDSCSEKLAKEVKDDIRV
ncbi:MAG: hypothetical protein DDT23_00379 [candidate division WS2 bacterium]|nr:hypothetical protein [Candidatus Lithacetigena glycinireducens]